MSTRRSAWAFVILGVSLAASSAAVAASDAARWDAVGARPATKTVPAATFSLHDVAGHAVSLDQFRGRVVMLYFWATW